MPNTPRFRYPTAHTVDVVDDYHGTLVPDPYRWLEEPESTETIAWTKAQNEFAQAFLQELPARATIQERLTQLWNHPRFTVPTKAKRPLFLPQK